MMISRKAIGMQAMKSLCALLLLTCVIPVAHAQTPSGFTAGTGISSSAVNTMFGSKADTAAPQFSGLAVFGGQANFKTALNVPGLGATYPNTGLTLGWNLMAGAGEVDMLLGPQGGTGGLKVWQLNTSGTIVGAAPIVSISHLGDIIANSFTGSLLSPTSTGGTFSGGDVSAQTALPNGATHARTIADKQGDNRGPAEYLSAGQTTAQLVGGTINAAPAINAALAVGSVQLPCGTYRLDGPLNPILVAGTTLSAPNPGCVTFNINFATGDVLTIGDLLNTFHGGSTRVSGVHFSAIVTRTSGYVIHVMNTHEVRMDNVTIDGPIFGGVWVQGGVNEFPTNAVSFLTHLSQFEISGGSADCVLISDYAANTYLANGVLSGCHNDLHIPQASGVYLNNVDIGAATNDGILIDPAACVSGISCGVNGLYFTNATADTPHNNAIEFAGTGNLSEIYFTNVWGAGAVTGSGFLFNSGIGLSGFSCVACDAHANAKHGFDIEGGGFITIGSGTKAQMNSRSGANLYDGIFVGGTEGNVTIQGVMAGSGGFQTLNGATQFQKYGLEVAAGATSLVIADNNLAGNSTGSANILTTAPNVCIHDNIGYSTHAFGQFNLAGASAFVVATGLTAPDAKVEITLTPLALPSAVGVSSYGAGFPVSGSFGVSTNATPTGAGLPFQWSATAFKC